jgi:hypothetical protein
MRLAVFSALCVLLFASAGIGAEPPPPPVQTELIEKGGAAPRLGKGDACYAICKYRDGEGGEFIGTSGTSCDEACVGAADKCLKQGEGNCQKFNCAMPGCE